MGKISQNQMAKLFHRLATGYTAGLDLRGMFRRETETGSHAYRIRSRSISKSLDSGSTLAQAMSKTEYFPELAVSVVKAGEVGGRLDESFRRLSKHYDNLVTFRKNFLLSISWPLFELGFSVCLVGVLILVLAWITSSSGGTPIDLFGMGWSPMQYFIAYWLIMATLFGTIFLVIWGAIKGWFGTLPMKIARRVPLIGKTIENLALSRFAWTLSVADNAGMDAVESVRLAARSTENYYYLATEEKMAGMVQHGKTFFQALRATKAYPEHFTTYVDTGEISGQLAETMQRASVNYQEDAERNMKLIGTIGFVLTLLFVAVLIGGTVIWLYKTLVIDQYNKILQDMVLVWDFQDWFSSLFSLFG